MNADERKRDFEKRELDKVKVRRKAEHDGDQDDRFVTNTGASSSSAPAAAAPAAADPVRVDKRKADGYPEGEEERLEEIVEDSQAEK